MSAVFLNELEIQKKEKGRGFEKISDMSGSAVNKSYMAGTVLFRKNV